jgi:PAS domain S-box-containing protein
MSTKLASERRIFLSTDIASRSEFRVALVAVLGFAAFFLALVPFATMPLMQVAPVIPAYNAGLIIGDLVTALLLLSRFSLLRSRALLVLASGYLFTAFITFSYTLAYPNLFAPTGLLGAGPESTAWLYMFWHAGFPLFVIAYCLLKKERPPTEPNNGPNQSSWPGAGFTPPVAVTLAFVVAFGLTAVATAGHGRLPALIVDGRFSGKMTGVVSSVWILSFLALIILWRQRPHTVLDVWLMVVMSAWICNIALGTAFNVGHSNLGFYVGRMYGTLAAYVLLVVLLLENAKHYLRLVPSESRYRGLLEAAPDAMVVVNHNGEIVLLNGRAEDQFGYSRDDLVGRKVEKIIPEGFTERLRADGRRSEADALAQQIGMGIELYGRRKNGTDFPIEIMLSPLESADGILVTAAIRDISVRKAAEVHLARMEGRYRGLLEAAPDAMVVVDRHGEIALLNVRAEEQFGYSRDELLGQKVTTIIPEGFAERMLADGRRSATEALAQQIGMGIELYGRRKNGSDFPIEIMLSPLESTEGILVTAAIRDISARREAEAQLLLKVEELNRSNVELEQFAYVASHDLQEPLRMVASFTQLLSRRYKGKLDADADDFIAFAVDGASRMQRLIQDLLMYSRVGTKAKKLLPTSSEIALNLALRNLHEMVEQNDAQVTHDPLPSVLADESQLIQLFQNLVGNAIKYQNSPPPRIHISATRSENKTWVFSVRDNGLGIDPRYFDKIFGMFQRLHKREEFAGTGIGLAICKKIVERHGGTICVESQPGQGSTFRFSLTESNSG